MRDRATRADTPEAGPREGPWVGRAVDRVDGRLKTTGGAVYAADSRPSAAPLYGVIVGATIARGRITSIDTGSAEAVRGVRLVLTHESLPRPARPADAPAPAIPNASPDARLTLADAQVRHWGQAVALVVADTLEAAQHAAQRVRIGYTPEPAQTDFYAHLDKGKSPRILLNSEPTDSARRDAPAAYAAAPVRLEAIYRTPYQIHNAMEPHAAVAEWQGDRLTLWTSTQIIGFVQKQVGDALGVAPENIRVISPFQGGGFGGKLIVKAETVLAAAAARVLKRPVKVVQTRRQMFSLVGHRPATQQTLRLAADADGRLLALEHHVVMQNATWREFAEQTATATRSLYSAPALSTSHRVTPLDLPTGESMRSPGEAPGLLALETAMDELAERLGLDPVRLRILNEPQIDEDRGIPFSARHLVRCYEEGAARFGWDRRPRTAASRREGRSLIGYGMAAAYRPAKTVPGSASATLRPDGTVLIRSDMTDIGTGSYTILSQIAADTLDVPLQRVRVELGDSRFPTGLGSGGSWGAASSGLAVRAACQALQAEFRRRAAQAKGRADLAAVLRTLPTEGVTANGQAPADPTATSLSKKSCGAHFAEVAVDADTGEVRVRRMLGVFDAGRILNPKTARSQLVGGMIWGISAALHEEGRIDTRYGAYVNSDLAAYHVPVHADVPEISVQFLDEPDDQANPLAAKGIGELGICGSAAAVGNAVYNATGVRVRSFPITVEKLLSGLPAL